jgi:hypothetical protein
LGKPQVNHHIDAQAQRIGKFITAADIHAQAGHDLQFGAIPQRFGIDQ